MRPPLSVRRSAAACAPPFRLISAAKHFTIFSVTSTRAPARSVDEWVRWPEEAGGCSRVGTGRSPLEYTKTKSPTTASSSGE